MYPILFQWNSIMIPSWHFFYALAGIACIFFLKSLRNRHYDALSSKHLSWIYFYAYLGGYIGARIFSIIIEQDVRSSMAFLSQLIQLGPMNFYGGFTGAIIFSSLYVLKKSMEYRKIFDISILTGFLGLSIGRIGCFLNGDDYGIAAARPSWWSVTFPNHELPVPRVPVQLMESFAVGVCVFLLSRYFEVIREKKGAGFIGLTLISFYAVLRFFLEFLRGDFRGWFIRDYLSPAQGISLILMFLFLPIFFYRLKSKSFSSNTP